MAQIQLGGSIGVPGSVAVLGSASVVFATDANHTMTSAEFSNKFLNVTSGVSLTATRVLFAPLNSGQEYVIQNNTTGGQSILIQGSSGTGVTIPTGATASVVCDGTKYIQTGGINGIVVSGVPTVGQVLTALSATTADWQTPTGGGGSFSAGGDLAGTPTNQEVIGIRTQTVPDIAGITAGNGYLNWRSTSWQYSNPSADVTLGGDVIGNATSNMVTAINHISIANTAILDGYALLATGTANAQFRPFPVSFPGIPGNSDIAGTLTQQEVVGIQTFPIPSIAGVTNGNGYLNWSGIGWALSNPSTAITLGGDVTGNATTNTVQKIQGISISNAAISNGMVLTATGPSNAAFQTPPNFVAGGDLAGSNTNQTVVALQSTPLSNLPPNTGDVLQFNTTITSEWAPAALSLGGDVTGSLGSNTVSKLQTYTLLIPSTPSDGDVLMWHTSLSRWQNTPISGTFTAGGDLTGTSTNQTVVSAQNNTTMFGASTGVTFANNMFFPGVTQASTNGSGASGKTLAISAQACTNTGTGTQGGALILASGTGDTVGQVLIQAGNTTQIDVRATSITLSSSIQMDNYTAGTPQFGSTGFISSYPVTFSGTPSAGQVLTATSSTAADWQTPTAPVTWSNDLAGSTNTNQYIAAISGNGGAGGLIPINAYTLSFGATQNTGGTVNIMQDQLPTAAGTGADGNELFIQAQIGQNAMGSFNSGAGGDLKLNASDAGSVVGGTMGNGGNVFIKAGFGTVSGAVHIADGTTLQEILVGNADIEVTADGFLVTTFNSIGLQLNAGLQVKTFTVTTSSYLIDSTSSADYTILCNFAGAIALTMPTPTAGRTIAIKDISGAAASNNITINPNVAEKFDGASTYVINLNNAGVILTSDGTNWFVMSAYNGTVV